MMSGKAKLEAVLASGTVRLRTEYGQTSVDVMPVDEMLSAADQHTLDTVKLLMDAEDFGAALNCFLDIGVAKLTEYAVDPDGRESIAGIVHLPAERRRPGRPSSRTEPTERVEVRLPASLVAQMDAATTNRTAFIEAAIRAALGRTEE